MEQLGQTNLDSRQKQVVMVSQDSFYKNLTEEQRECADAGEYNFDHPGMVCVCVWNLLINKLIDKLLKTF